MADLDLHNASSDFLEMTNDQLLAEVGRVVPQRELLPRGFESLMRDGRLWMDENRDRLGAAICSDANVSRLADSEDATTVVAALVDALAGILGHPTVFAAAVLLYRYGITKFCLDHGN